MSQRLKQNLRQERSRKAESSVLFIIGGSLLLTGCNAEILKVLASNEGTANVGSAPTPANMKTNSVALRGVSARQVASSIVVKTESRAAALRRAQQQRASRMTASVASGSLGRSSLAVVQPGSDPSLPEVGSGSEIKVDPALVYSLDFPADQFSLKDCGDGSNILGICDALDQRRLADIKSNRSTIDLGKVKQFELQKGYNGLISTELNSGSDLSFYAMQFDNGDLGNAYVSIPRSQMSSSTAGGLGSMIGEDLTITGFFKWDGNQYPYCNVVNDIPADQRPDDPSALTELACSDEPPKSKLHNVPYFNDWSALFANGWNGGDFSLIFNTHKTFGRNEIRLNVDGRDAISVYKDLEDGRWHSFAVTSRYQDGGRIVTLYIDDNLSGSRAYSGKMRRSTQNFTFGGIEAYDAAGSEFFGYPAFYIFGGGMAKVRIYNTAKSFVELDALKSIIHRF